MFAHPRHRLSALVRRLGKRFGIDATYFVKSSLTVTLTYGATVLSGLVTGYLVARMFPPELYGGYKFVLSIVGIVSMISIPGLASAISRDIARRGRDKTPLRWTLSTNVLLCLAGALILLCMIGVLPLWHRTELWPLFVIAALLFIPNQVGSTFLSGIVTGTEKFGLNLRITMVSSLIVIPTVLLMLWLHPSAEILMALTIGVPSLLYLWVLRKEIKKYPSRERSNDVTAYGVQLSINTIPVTVANYVDDLLISALFGLTNLGIFSAAVLIPEQIKTWSKYLLPVTFARQAAGDDSAARRRKMLRAVGLGTAVFAAGIALYVLVAPWLLDVLFPRYHAQMATFVLYSRVSALTLLPIPGTLLPQYLEARGMVRESRISQWWGTAAQTVLLFALIPIMGPVGAIIARGAFRVVYVGYSYWVLGRLSKTA